MVGDAVALGKGVWVSGRVAGQEKRRGIDRFGRRDGDARSQDQHRNGNDQEKFSHALIVKQKSRCGCTGFCVRSIRYGAAKSIT